MKFKSSGSGESRTVTKLEWNLRSILFQRWLVKLFILREFTSIKERCNYNNISQHEANTKGQLPQPAWAVAMSSLTQDLRANPRWTRTGNYAYWICSLCSPQRTTVGPEAPRDLPGRTNWTVHSRKCRRASDRDERKLTTSGQSSEAKLV